MAERERTAVVAANWKMHLKRADAERYCSELLAAPLPHGVEVFQVHGTLFFGAASKFKDAMRRVEKPPRVLILRLREVLAIDATGLRALEDVLDKARADGTQVLMTGVQAQPRSVLARSGILEQVGEENVVPDFRRAVERARSIVGAPAE